MKQFLCIQLLVCLGWLSCIALAQLEISHAIAGSASFPHVAITTLGNLAVFITCMLKKRFHLEMGARDLLVINASPFKFEETRGKQLAEKKKVPCTRKLAEFISSFLRLFDLEMSTVGLMASSNEIISVFPWPWHTTSVVMLSNSAGMTNSSLRQFMGYIQNVHHVQPLLLKYDLLRDKEVHCKSGRERHICNCIVISKVEFLNMPSVLPECPAVLTSLQCLEYECHGCNRDLLHVEEVEYKLNFNFSSAVCDALDFQFTTPAQKHPICLCIPVHPASDDEWTKLLVRFLKYKDPGDNTDLAAAAEVLQSYLDKAEDRAEGRAEDRAEDSVEVGVEDRDAGRAEMVEYKTVPFIVIRFVEIFVNLLLTVFFKVDGFSSSLAARRVVRSYVVDEKGKGLSVNSFLTSCLVVKSDSVCQVLKFRGNTNFLLLIVGCVNLICSIAWALVLIAFNGGVGKWYAVPCMEPSRPRVAVIIAAICIGIGMDCSDPVLELCRTRNDWYQWTTDKVMLVGVIILEIAFAVAAGALGFDKGGIGRWVYGALQLLVWVKWGIGSYLIGAYSPDLERSKREKDENGHVILDNPSRSEEGSLPYCSSFFLNAVMVGVMGDWAGIWNTWK